MSNVPDQLETLFREEYSSQVKALSGRAGGIPNAEDIVSEAYCRALKHQDSFDGSKASLEVWLQRIIKTCMYDFKSKELQQGLVKDEMDKDEPYENFRSLGVSTLKEVVKEIEKREGNHYYVLYLTYVKGYRPREIGEIVDESARNIENILRRFKAEMCQKYGDSDGHK